MTHLHNICHITHFSENEIIQQCKTNRLFMRLMLSVYSNQSYGFEKKNQIPFFKKREHFFNLL